MFFFSRKRKQVFATIRKPTVSSEHISKFAYSFIGLVRRTGDGGGGEGGTESDKTAVELLNLDLIVWKMHTVRTLTQQRAYGV